MPGRLIQVVAGAISDRQGRVLIAQRPERAHQGGLWEFPGGKLEVGERPEHGLRRELEEELGIRVLAARPLIRVRHDYGDRAVELDVHRILRFTGVPSGREGQPLAWCHPCELDASAFPAADRPVIRALQLPDRMLVTGPDPSQPVMFLERLRRALARGARLVQLRAPGLERGAFARLASAARRHCHDYGAKLLLNADPEWITGLPCDGWHLTARRLRASTIRPGPVDLLIGASCHNGQELALADRLGLDYALLSPVKSTRSHPDARPLGWSGFAAFVDSVNLPVYALGGLSEADLEAAWQAGAQGIAAIRALWSDGAAAETKLL